MSSGPLDEILRTEQSVTAAISAAREEASTTLADNGRLAEQMVEDARSRGQAIAEKRYQEGLARARDEGDLIRSTADELVSGLRRRTDPHMSSAVDLVIDTVLPSPEVT